VATKFPDKRECRETRPIGQTDEDIWNYARTNGFCIVIKTSDFYHRALLYGAPRRFIWRGLVKCTRDELLALLFLLIREK